MDLFFLFLTQLLLLLLSTVIVYVDWHDAEMWRRTGTTPELGTRGSRQQQISPAQAGRQFDQGGGEEGLRDRYLDVCRFHGVSSTGYIT
jgi:hypothetical protein